MLPVHEIKQNWSEETRETCPHIDTLKHDTDLDNEEMKTLMQDRKRCDSRNPLNINK